MKAIVCDGAGGEDVLRVADIDPPSLDTGDLRIAVDAAGVNRADLLQRRGLYPPPPGTPETLGLECAGRVVEIGPEAHGFEIGERVMALVAGGGQAEEVVVHHTSAMRVPDRFDDIEAGGFPEVFLTAFLNLFLLGELGERQTALVHGGSGGVGTAAIRLARIAGARIIVTAGSPERCDRCRELGADVAVEYRKDDFVDAVRDATDGRGADVVLDCVGGAYLARNLEAIGADGRLVVIGLMGGTTGELDLRRLLTQRIRIIGSTLRALPLERKAAIVAAFLDRFGEPLADGRLHPVIDSAYPMERVADAHRRLASGSVFGKVVLSVS